MRLRCTWSRPETEATHGALWAERIVQKCTPGTYHLATRRHASSHLRAGVQVATGSDGRFQAVREGRAVGKGFRDKRLDSSHSPPLNQTEQKV